MDQETRALLVMELASCHDEDVASILARYGLGSPETDPEAARILSDPTFQSAVRDETLRVLRGRARVDAASALVRSIPVVEEIVRSANVPPQDRISGVATLTRIAGVETKPTEGQGAHGVSIVFNIPAPPGEVRTVRSDSPMLADS
jgi:hypothetical protein